MNILYLCDEYPPGRHGGIGTAVQLLARQMVQLGHTVVVAGFCDWGYGQADEDDDHGVKVYRFRRGLDSGWFSKKDSLRVRATYKAFYMNGIFQQDIVRSLKRYEVFVEDIISKHKIDVAERPDFNEYAQYCKSYVPSIKLSVPTVVKLHGSISYFMKEAGQQVPDSIYRTDKDILHSATAVSSVSAYTAEKTAEYMDYSQATHVLYNGIDTNRNIKTEKDKKLVIFSGSLVEKKGVYQLMKAWSKVHEQMPDVRLELYGKGNVKRTKAYLAKEAYDSVSFKGHIPRQQLLERLGTAMAAVFPSYAETFGLGAVEAMACGTATIFSSKTAGPEIITDGVDGLLVNPEHDAALADKIMYLLNNEAVNKQLAAAGKEKVLSTFDIRVVAKNNEAFYASLLRP